MAMNIFSKILPMPDDIYNRKLLSLVHPENWINPVPAKCYNLVVIGAGTAGLITAYAAASLGAKVALVEKNLMGGDCLNVGCIPSKTLARAARICSDIRHAVNYGVRGNMNLENFEVDFEFVMERIRSVRSQIAHHDSAERFSELGVDIFFGKATFLDKITVGVGAARLHFKKAVIATGSRPRCPQISGMDEKHYLNNETVFNLTQLPKRLMVIGGGPLGCELGQAFQRFGSQVTIVQNTPLFLHGEERDAAQLLSDSFAKDEIQIRLNSTVTGFRTNGEEKIVQINNQDHIEEVHVDAILTGIGRLPNIEGLSLESASINYNEKGITVNDFLQTSNPNIYAAGDVCTEYKYTHVADATARIVVQNALFLGRKKISDLIIPWCTYTDPEIAHIGVYVRDARAIDIPIKSYTIPMHQVDRAVADGEDQGFVKIHVREGTDKILGATIVARHAGEMINEVSLAMVAGLGLRDIEKVIHSYPTQVEGIKKAADAYNRSKLTPFIGKLSRYWLNLTR
jgi:pyruvate/2-oxoglutarate dehydrogenase complex dihydrolipoamide dehydrogenase (E3) component